MICLRNLSVKNSNLIGHSTGSPQGSSDLSSLVDEHGYYLTITPTNTPETYIWEVCHHDGTITSDTTNRDHHCTSAFQLSDGTDLTITPEQLTSMAEKLRKRSRLTWIGLDDWQHYKEIQQANKDLSTKAIIGGASLVAASIALEQNRKNVALAEFNEQMDVFEKKGFAVDDRGVVAGVIGPDGDSLWPWVDHKGSPVKEKDLSMHFKQLYEKIHNLSDDGVNIYQLSKNASENFDKSHIFSDEFVAFVSEKLNFDPTQSRLSSPPQIPQTDQEFKALQDIVVPKHRFDRALSQPDQYLQAIAEEFLTQHSPRDLIAPQYWDSLLSFHSPNQMYRLISEAPLHVFDQARAFVNHQSISPYLIELLSNHANIEKSPLTTVNATGNIVTTAEMTEYSARLNRQLEALELPPEYLQRAKQYLSNPEAYRTPQLSSTGHIYSEGFESFITKEAEARIKKAAFVEDTKMAEFIKPQDRYQLAVQNMVDNTLTASPEKIERLGLEVTDLQSAGNEFLSGGDKTIKNLINERYWPDFLAYNKSQKLAASLGGEAFNLLTGARAFVEHKGINPRFRYLTDYLSGYMSSNTLAKLMRSGSTKQVNRVSKVVDIKPPTLPGRMAKFTARVPALVPILATIGAGLAAIGAVGLYALRSYDKELETTMLYSIDSYKNSPENSKGRTVIDVLSVGTEAFPLADAAVGKNQPIAITKILDHLGTIITRQPNEQNISEGSLLKCLPSPSNEPQCTPVNYVLPTSSRARVYSIPCDQKLLEGDIC